MRTYLPVMFAVIVFGPCSAAQAQDISGRPDVQRFEAYLESNAELAVARQAHMISVRDLRHPNCHADPTYRRVPPDAVGQYGITWAPVIGMPHLPTSATDTPTGSWGESFEVNYCGDQVFENIVVNIRDANTPVRIAWQPPGHSLADIALTLDLLRQLHIQGLLMGTRGEPRCSAPMNLVASIIDTEIHTPQRNGGRWVEHWTLRHCGQTAVMAITLTPSARGGTDYVIAELNPPRGGQRTSPVQPSMPSDTKPDARSPSNSQESTARPPNAQSRYPGDDDDRD